MKRIFVLASILATFLMASTAFAAPVVVDFSVLGSTVDITVPNSLTLDGVTFQYQPPGTASADSGGIFGSSEGFLVLQFSPLAATALNFDFTLPTLSAPVADGLVALFDNGDTLTVASSIGALAYSGSPFSQASLFFYFNLDPGIPPGTPTNDFFTVSNISYSPVPEPSAILLLASGLVGLVGWRRFGRK